jgi:hypothetical protein
MMMNKWFTNKGKKETFVDFNKSEAQNSSMTVYIPQYSSDKNRTLIHLYDNLYFDQKNGAVIEVNGTQTKEGPPDTTGNSITEIEILPRDGKSFTTIPSNGQAKPNDSYESTITTTNASYNQYTYKTKTLITDGSYYYQYFYYSWNTQTFIHLFKCDSKLTYLKSYMLTPNDGLKNQVNPTLNISFMPTGKPATYFSVNDTNNNKTTTLSNYINNVSVFQITASVFYDIANGNIILKRYIIITI